MRKFFAAAAVAAIAFAGAANAEFFPGQAIAVNGSAGPEFGGTAWGTWEGQGVHNIGGLNTYFDPFFTTFTLEVSSQLDNPWTLSFLINYSNFAPGDFSDHFIEILGLKQDGSILSVSSNMGNIATDGNNVFWSGTGAELTNEPDLEITVVQVPAPGAIALLGVAGLVARRRRA